MSRYALLVGASTFGDAKLKQLAAPASDLSELAEILGNPKICGFQVSQLLDQPSYKITPVIESFFAERDAADLVLLYISTHGIKDERGELYYAATNTQIKLLRSTGIAANFVNSAMSNCRSHQLVVLLDCCHSGAFARGMVPKTSLDVGTDEYLKGGKVVLTASDALQYAFEGDTVLGRGPRSIFTKNIVEGLKTGQADLDGDGRVSVEELFEFVRLAMKREGIAQTPLKWTFEAYDPIYIAFNPRGVQPAKLSPELLQALENPIPNVRIGALKELSKLLRSANQAVALAARMQVEILKEDDSKAVRTEAAAILAQDCRESSFPPGPQISQAPQDLRPEVTKTSVPAGPSEDIRQSHEANYKRLWSSGFKAWLTVCSILFVIGILIVKISEYRYSDEGIALSGVAILLILISLVTRGLRSLSSN